MAYQSLSFVVGALVAGANLSEAQFRCVTVDENGAVVRESVAGAASFGILQDNPESGAAASVGVSGISKAVAGDTVTPGMRWATDSQGRVVEAAAEDYSPGVVLEGGSVGEIVTVTLGLNPMTIPVES